MLGAIEGSVWQAREANDLLCGWENQKNGVLEELQRLPDVLDIRLAYFGD